RGGVEPTVTDANLVLGRLLENSPLAGGLQLDRAASEEAVARLAEELDLDLLACAEGIVRVAEAEMLGAMRVMTLERGIDPRGFALMPFGGAGPLHASALASELGISRVLCPRASGVLCALGLAAAPARRDAAKTVILSGRSLSPERLDRERSTLVAQANAMLAGPPARVRIRHELRYSGQAFELPVEEAIDDGEQTGLLDPDGLREAFVHIHEQRYGYRDESADIELVNIRVSVWDAAPTLALLAGRAANASAETGEVVFAGERLRCTVLRGEPAPGSNLEGPMLCALPDSTLLIAPGWSGTVDAHGTIHLDRESEG
ncbi:MAG TPA: hydantoinase/oxoprolinase family protein, partial [Solirubrobacteraceae bacterium]|nr:hydantoinase/oxoprolinase family protein [Solirubrobacteraceae bacterium]